MGKWLKKKILLAYCQGENIIEMQVSIKSKSHMPKRGTYKTGSHTHTHVKAAQFHASSVMKTKTNHFGGYRTACENGEKGRNAEL